MNWVGGSRNRLVKDDAKKQRDYFEKRKMQKRLKSLGLALPTSPAGCGPGPASKDLVTLFIVNQIASKKENKDQTKVATFGGSSNRKGSSHQNKPLVLPMSPCSPSQLSLVESQNQCSIQGMRKGRNVIPQGFKCRQLSPVLESGFSDNSASDYTRPAVAPSSPFSSTSSSSSGHGVFPLQLNPQQTQLPPPPPPWDTVMETKFQPFTQPRGMTQSMPWSFGSNSPLSQLETPTSSQVPFGSPGPQERDHPTHKVSISVNDLHFTLNKSGTEPPFEDDVFSGFCNDDGEKDDFPFMSAKSKIYLRDDTPVKSSAPQTVPETQGRGVEVEKYGPPCAHTFDSSYMEHCRCADNDGPHTPLAAFEMMHTIDEKVLDNTVCSENPPGSGDRHIASRTEFCKCCKLPRDTCDAGTQTVDIPAAAEKRDAWTQSSFVSDATSKVPFVKLSPVCLSAATGMQTDPVAEANMHVSSTANRGQQIVVSKRTARSLQCEGNMLTQTPKQHSPGERCEEGRDERGPVMKELSKEVREGVTSANRPVDETATLQEIADILILLRQKKN